MLVHQDPALCEYGFICHEMGRGHGLPHSCAANPDFEYGDSWDVMGFTTTTFQFPITFNGTAGQRDGRAERAQPRGAGRAPRRAGVGRRPGPDFSSTVTLDPLNQPLLGNHGQLVVRIPPGATRPRGRRGAPSWSSSTQGRLGPGDPGRLGVGAGGADERARYLQPGIWSGSRRGKST